MTQKDKELLLKDLSARLPYKVIVDYGYNAFDVHNGNYVKHGFTQILRCDLLDIFISPRQNEKGEYIKPYLRPMSSMTEKEKKELKTLFDAEEITSDSICYLEGGTLEEYLSHISYSFCSKIIDWLNAHHFDYRGLIPKGLAIKVTKENNPYEFGIKTS